MILINNKLVQQTPKGFILVGKTPFKKVGNTYEPLFKGEISRADLERIYVFEILREDKEKRDYKKFLDKLDDLLYENDIIKE